MKQLVIPALCVLFGAVAISCGDGDSGDTDTDTDTNTDADFITTWKTDNPGVSDDNQITLPAKELSIICTKCTVISNNC